MTTVFMILFGCGALLGLLAFWLILRARSAPPVAAKPADQAAAGIAARLTEWTNTALEALDYARTRREWRYAMPWVLLLGERGAGKTSFARSAGVLRQPHPDARYASLQLADTTWSVLNRGVLIDVDGKVASCAPADPAATGAAAEKSAAASAASWKKLLGGLVDLRPERPIDAVVLTVSAHTLLAGGDGLDAAGADAYRQLCEVQDEFEFVLPVYVVVTQCDAVDGFGAFWRAQSADYRAQMFGWSAPASAPNQAPGEWADAAFGTVVDRLRALQLDAAAHPDDDASPADLDGVILFPACLSALRSACARWLGAAFRGTADRPGHLCRGIYFCGDVDDRGGAALEARDDVSFVAGLVGDKVLAEPHLARAVSSSAWSRNRFLRFYQIGALVCAALLLIGLALAGLSLHRKVERLDTALTRLQSVPRFTGGTCPSAGQISTLLMGVRTLDTDSSYVLIPWSWWTHPLRDGTARVVAAHAFSDMILPALGCQLQVRAEELIRSGARKPDVTDPAHRVDRYREALYTQLQGVADYETAAATYRNAARPLAGAAGRNDLERFAHLLSFTYGLSPKLVTSDLGGVFASALSMASTDYKPNVPAGLQEIYAADLQRMATALQGVLLDESAQGGTILAALQKGSVDPVVGTRHFGWWLNWVRNDWLGAAPGEHRNPCQTVRADMTQQIHQLVRIDDDYRPLLRSIDQFGETTCEVPVYAALDALTVPPYGPLVVREEGAQILNPALANEFAGMAALPQLTFMQIATRQPEPFACRGDVDVWDADAVGQAARFVSEYRGYPQRFGLPPVPDGVDPAKRPLYDQIARRQLENALNHSLNQAQRPPAAGADGWQPQVSPIAAEEQSLAQSSRDLARGLGGLVAIQRSYDELGFARSGAGLSACLQQFTADHLAQVQGLAVQSRLYDPQADGAGDAFYDLATVPVTRDYLARQVARAQVLAGYAAPFTSLAQNSPNPNGAARADTDSAVYWGNTIGEVNRYVPSNDPSSQLGELAALFVDRLTGMNASNCHARMQGYNAGDDGANDLFAGLRRTLVASVGLRCDNAQGANAVDAFQQLFTQFDLLLGSRYPFGPSTARDATVYAVQSFFAAYGRQRDALMAQLGALPKAQQAAARSFLGQLDEARTFFADTLAADGSLSVKLTATFNAAPGGERGADQVVAWDLASGEQEAGYPNQPNTLNWVAGQPLAFDATWADLSAWVPRADPSRADAPAVQGRTASFDTAGTWALLRMLQLHASSAAAPGDAVALRFDVPVAPTAASTAAAAKAKTPAPAPQTAELQLNLLLQGVDPSSRAAVALKLPSFPQRAPTLTIEPKSGAAVSMSLMPPLPPGM